MRKKYYKKGSAIITAVGLGTVLLIIIIGIFSFTQYRTQTVIQESKNIKALALAEAGLEVALGELYNNSAFATHKIKINGKELDWDEKENCENTLEKNDYFGEPSASQGTLSGKLGDGTYKVRVGSIPCKDDENTETIDEKKAYIKIEALGLFDNTIRRVVAIVNRRFPAREFLMYDGKVLSLIYGQTGESDSDGVNVFSTGHLYGHEKIEISRITMSEHNSAKHGTTQQLDNINAILSNGKIFFYSDIKAKFKNKTGEIEEMTIKPNATFPTGSSGYKSKKDEEKGDFPESLEKITPTIAEELKPWIKDKTDGENLPPEKLAPDFDKCKEEAKKGGFDVSPYLKKYRIHKGWNDGTSKGAQDALDVVYLDFGNNIHESQVKDFPSNGVIYSDKDIVVKGNPPKDCYIVSEKNVFIAGDFNQAGDKSKDEEFYGFPQIYKSGESALKSTDYCEDSFNLFKDDINLPEGKKHHVAATIIAKERVVYDHRSPVDCFENELYPFLKYELVKALSTNDGESEAEKAFNPQDRNNICIKTESSDGFKESINKFADTFKLANKEELVNGLESFYSDSNSIDGQKVEELTKKAWEIYVKDFENNGDSNLKGQPRTTDVKEQGIYKLLFNLRKMMSGDEYGSNNITKQGGYLCYPEMTTNGMFISCGEQANTYYAGPSVTKYYDEIGFSSMTSSFIGNWYHTTAGFVHRTFGSETYFRLYKVTSHPNDTGNNYYPPTRHKIYDNTLPFLNEYGNNPLEITAFLVLSWQEYKASKEYFDKF